MKKILSSLNLQTLNTDVVEYKTIHDFIKKENYIQYLYDICFLSEQLFHQYILEYRNNSFKDDVSEQDMEMLFAIKSVKAIYKNHKAVLKERIEE